MTYSVNGKKRLERDAFVISMSAAIAKLIKITCMFDEDFSGNDPKDPFFDDDEDERIDPWDDDEW